NFAMRRSNSEEWAIVRAVIGFVRSSRDRRPRAASESPHESPETPRACRCRAFGRQPYRGWFRVGWCDPRNRPQTAPRKRRSSLRPEPLRYYGAQLPSLRPILSCRSSNVPFQIGSLRFGSHLYRLSLSSSIVIEPLVDNLAIPPLRDRHLLRMHRLAVRGDPIRRGLVERHVVTNA